MKAKFIYIVVFIFITTSVFSQNYFEIKNKVDDYNKLGKFENSIELITNNLDNENLTNYEKYQILILKSYTYKSLFDYDKTIESLNAALKIGIKSDKKEEVIANVKAELAFAYFDVLKYKESAKLMDELKANNYNHLNLGSTSYIIMQYGYLDFLNKKYDLANIKYDEAISIMKIANPQNLPVIYGKKILLHSKLKNKSNALSSFNEGVFISKKHKSIKYLLYLNECLRTFYEENKEWENAEKTFHRVDSLRFIYNAEEKNNKINILVKNLEIQKKENELKKSNLYRNFFFIISLVLLVGIYLFFKLLKSNKEKNILLEKENNRIHDELQLLTSNLTAQGFVKIDLSSFNLTERQLEIIELIRQGKSNKEIANKIFISENTVKYHLKAIYDIMKIENRTEFIKMMSK